MNKRLKSHHVVSPSFNPAPVAETARELKRVLHDCQRDLAPLRRALTRSSYLHQLEHHAALLRESESIAKRLERALTTCCAVPPPPRGSASPAVAAEAALRLTAREREVLCRVADGQPTKQMAMELHVTAKAIEAHRTRLMNKLGLHNVAELTKFAVRAGLSSL